MENNKIFGTATYNEIEPEFIIEDKKSKTGGLGINYKHIEKDVYEFWFILCIENNRNALTIKHHYLYKVKDKETLQLFPRLHVNYFTGLILGSIEMVNAQLIKKGEDKIEIVPEGLFKLVDTAFTATLN
jgi:hypothetical protein